MKKELILILGVFMLLIACAQTNTQSITTPQPVQQTPETPSAAAATNLEATTLAKNDITQDLVIPINIIKGKSGDSFVFGAVFNLVNRQGGTYLAKVTFLDGRDSSNNPIEISADTANSWVVPVPSFTAEVSKPYYMPITVNPKGTVVPGSYAFEVQMYQESRGFDVKLDNVVKTIYVKVG